MASQRKNYWPFVTLFFGILLVIVALPQNAKWWAPSFLRTPTFHFGLDLVGGTQLDFRISEQEINEQIDTLQTELQNMKAGGLSTAEDIANLEQQIIVLKSQQDNVMEAIRAVLERRINALGVSEATITPSYVGNEKHLLVECPGVVDVQQCIDTVGKTIALEFKEEFTEATADFEKSIRDKATATLSRITQSGETLAVVGQDLSNELGVAYTPDGNFFRSDLPKGLESLWDAPAGGPIRRIEGSITGSVQAEDGSTQTKEIPGIFLARVIGPRTQTGRTLNDAPSAFGLLATQEPNSEYKTYSKKALDTTVPEPVATKLRSMTSGDLQSVDAGDGTARVLFLRSLQPGQEKMGASHILISYKGAIQADAGVTRTKEEALTLAESLKKRVDAGENFTTLATQFSDGPSKETGGSLGEFGRGEMVPQFEAVSFTLAQGAISTPVETQFGYHIIRSDRAPFSSEDHADWDELIVRGDNALSRADALITKLKDGEVKTMEEVAHIEHIFFSLVPTGWKDTALDGKRFRSASVTLDPNSNRPVVQITFDKEGGDLFAELTKKNIGKRIAIFVGGQLVSAPTVQAEIIGGTAVITGSQNLEEARLLATDLNTGAIPAPIYLTGQRTVEATLGASAMQTSLKAALVGMVILMLFLLFVYRLPGLFADIALLSYAFLLFALLKLPLFLFSSQYIVLTLAGMAGIILSIGMAVDTNVLIFERMKEEMRKGKSLKTAARIGFERAWPSIRDGNASTFITCAILFMIGTSIVRGFAITLAVGLLISMFTAIAVTRWLLARIADTPIAEKRWLFFRANASDVPSSNNGN